MQSEGIQVISASKEYLDAVEKAGYNVSHLRPRRSETGLTCTGNHRYFVASDASHDGAVIVFLVCTGCGEGKRVDFQVASKASSVEVYK